MFDQIGSADMSQGVLTTFTSDRFGFENSALALNGGWTYVPPGIYFDSPEFTISTWIYPQSVDTWARLIDFGNGPSVDELVFALTLHNSQQPVLRFFAGSVQVLDAISSQTLTPNEWQFLTATFDGSYTKIYINGFLKANSYNPFIMPSIQRTNCYIGKSSWPNGYSASYLDDLRFYNKSLNQEEILQLMNQNGTCEFLFLRL
jgi:hypothetical protein